MKKFRSILSIVLVALMLFSLFVVVPITVSAAGEIAGNGTNGISININASPYTDYAKKDYGQYAYTKDGCAWFASARVCQVTGKNTNILSGSSWYSTGYSTYGFSRGQSIKAKALACYSNHVAVVEIVNGNTVTVSEGGMPSYPNNGYCVIRTTTVSELQNRSACGSFLGYVYIGGGGSTPAPSGNNPIGYLDSVSSPSPGKIRVAGWSLDLDKPTTSIAVHIYVGGPAGSAGAEGHPITANTLRSDVGSAYSKYGVGNLRFQPHCARNERNVRRPNHAIRRQRLRVPGRTRRKTHADSLSKGSRQRVLRQGKTARDLRRRRRNILVARHSVGICLRRAKKLPYEKIFLFETSTDDLTNRRRSRSRRRALR